MFSSVSWCEFQPVERYRIDVTAPHDREIVLVVSGHLEIGTDFEKLSDKKCAWSEMKHNSRRFEH